MIIPHINKTYVKSLRAKARARARARAAKPWRSIMYTLNAVVSGEVVEHTEHKSRAALATYTAEHSYDLFGVGGHWETEQEPQPESSMYTPLANSTHDTVDAQILPHLPQSTIDLIGQYIEVGYSAEQIHEDMVRSNNWVSLNDIDLAISITIGEQA